MTLLTKNEQILCQQIIDMVETTEYGTDPFFFMSFSVIQMLHLYVTRHCEDYTKIPCGPYICELFLKGPAKP